MKIWHGFGSEHSANLVMIGRFRDVGTALKAKDIIDRIEQQVHSEIKEGGIIAGEIADQYSESMLKLLQDLNYPGIDPDELEQFDYGVQVKHEEKELIITTDEIAVSAFFKVLFNNGARIEVYSAHDYPDSEYGRGK